MNEQNRMIRELNLQAKTDRLSQVMDFVGTCLEDSACSPKTQMQIDLAVEEIFINVANYAYAPGSGDVIVRVEALPDTVYITFIDSGTPYNPLKKPDPDVTLSAQDRQIGGLGIFMTKKLMDDVTYAYKDGRNVLTLKKTF